MNTIAQIGLASPEIEISPAMIAAGLAELGDHSFGSEMSYVIECVYRAMTYAARVSASETSASR